MSRTQNRIRQIRTKKKISGTKIAKQLSISPQYFYDIEKGERNLSADLALRISEILGVSVNYLLGGEASDDENTLIEMKNVTYNDRELNSIILDKLKVLTDDEGYFIEDVQEDIFNTIDDTLYMSSAFPEPGLYSNYISEFERFFNAPYEDFDDKHRVEINKEFNEVFNYRTIKLVLDKNNYDDKHVFLESLEQIILKHDLKPKNPLSNEREFIRDLELSDKNILEEYDLKLDGKKLTEDEARGLIAYLRSLRQL